MATARARTRTSATQVRAALVAAGRRIIERDGPAALTVRAVAAEAGVAPMGVYNHFEGKDGLLDAVVTDGFAEFGRVIAATDADPDARLFASGRAYRRYAIANPELYGLMFSAECHPDLKVAANAFAVLAEIIRFGQVAGVLMPGDPEHLALRVWSCVHGAVALELAGTHPPHLDAEANFEQVLDLIRRGLARPDGAGIAVNMAG